MEREKIINFVSAHRSLYDPSEEDYSNRDKANALWKMCGEFSKYDRYGEYPELCGILHKYIKCPDKVLNIGCGSSTLSADMYDVGYKNIVNIDISNTVIKQMVDKYQSTRPQMSYLQMDMLQMDFEDSEFGVVLDKGTLDALLTDDSPDTLSKVDKMFGEIGRVLRVGGRYICVSLAQDHILKKVLQFFPNEGWMTRICRVTDSDRDDEKEFHMPVFVYVFTKFKKMPNMKKILEITPFDEKIERYDTTEELLEGIKLMQNYGIVRQQLNKGTADLDEHISLDLFSSELDSPRYTVHVVDSPRPRPNKFAVFIVPEGREIEWLFSTYEGRKELAKNAGFQRLLVVTLHREHTYTSIDDVKAELGVKVMEVAPSDLGNKQVPYLSLGDDINQRVIRYQGNSTLSGDFVVEDVEVEKETYRRLIFMNNKTLVQSEARLKKENNKKRGGKRNTKMVPDAEYLSCSYYSVMVSGFALVQDCQKTMESGLNVLLVGLGGGGLPLFIHKHFHKVNLEVVEIDEEMVTVSKNWFGFSEDERLKVHVGDGLKFIEEMSEKDKKYDVVIIDVDNKDKSVGMSCPPEPFVQQSFLSCISKITQSNGLCMVNMACRNCLLRNETVDSFKAVFNLVFTKKLTEDINEIIFAFPRTRSTLKEHILSENNTTSETVEHSLKVLQQCVVDESRSICKTDLPKALEGLSLS